MNNFISQAEGHCLGSKGVSVLVRYLQNKVVEKGYITALVFAPEQDLKKGVLHLTLQAGYISRIAFSPGVTEYINIYNAFPSRKGELLNLRDLEQGQENLLRLPTVESEMNIIPGKLLGESDIEVNWKQNKKWRVYVSLDDSGLDSTGRYQGTLMLSLDNPLYLSDLFYILGNSTLQKNNNGKNSRYIAAHYSVPFGYWLVGASGSHSDYQQVISGYYSDFIYSGVVDSFEVWLQRVLSRDAKQKTTLTGTLLSKSMRNYLEDIELETQRRLTTAWRVGILHERSFGEKSLKMNATYQQGNRWFGALPAPEESSGQASALSKIGTFSAQLNVPFKFNDQYFRYNTRFQGQISSSPLTPQDQLSIGNRWAVRGFDGQRSLTASHGWFIRNDLAWRSLLQSQELYLGLDYGQVGGYGSNNIIGNKLSGTVIGLRGNSFNICYDIFVGVPLSRPKGFASDNVIFGFNTNWSY